jgi:ferredoxin
MDPSYTITWILADGSVRETAGYRQLNILGHAEIFEIPMRQVCGGQSECGTCRIVVNEGTFTEFTGPERILMEKHKKSFKPGERLACQARPRSDAIIRTPAVKSRDLRENDED